MGDGDGVGSIRGGEANSPSLSLSLDSSIIAAISFVCDGESDPEEEEYRESNLAPSFLRFDRSTPRFATVVWSLHATSN